MTNEPKYIGENAYSLLKSDVLNMFKKGKYSTIPFLLIIMILFHIVVPFIFYKVSSTLVNSTFSQILFLFTLPILSFMFNISIFAFNNVFNHLYTKSKFRIEENTDIFFYSLKHFKIIWRTIKFPILFLSILTPIVLIIMSLPPFSDGLGSEDLRNSLSEQNIVQMKVFYLFLTYIGFFFIQNQCFNESIYKKENEFIFINMNLIYMNQEILKMSLEESILYTQKGIDKNKNLFFIIEKTRDFSFLIYIPFINSFMHIYYVFLYHAAWQRIYNNQNGITAKEEIKNRVHNKNTVVN